MGKDDLLFCGIDVGGTHADGVVIRNGDIVACCKVETNHADLVGTVKGVLDRLLQNIDELDGINISTTLSTNAIVEGDLERVGVVVSAGPGVNPDLLAIGDDFEVVGGSIDHRGKIVQELNTSELARTLDGFANKEIKVFSLVTKFSTRNPQQEEYMAEAIKDKADYVSLGHRLSGSLNFPRRINTSYYNSAVWRKFSNFAGAVEKSLDEYGDFKNVNILKADGGTMPLKEAVEYPVETIISGPAASVMGITALCEIEKDAIILDIGGTTTDVIFFANAAPVFEPEGIAIDKKPSLVRAFRTSSIGIGGDSAIRVDENGIKVGPDRLGKSLALGGNHCSLIDAFNVTKNLGLGDVQASFDGVKKLAEKAGEEINIFSKKTIEIAVERIYEEVVAELEEINQKPVYTIQELIEGKKIEPSKIFLMGGPARAFEKEIRQRFGLPVEIPENFAIANAIGAALSKATKEVELFADTEKGELIIPNLGIKKKIDKSYNLFQAEKDAKFYLEEFMKEQNIIDGSGAGTKSEAKAEVIESSSFNMVDGFNLLGKNIRVKSQIRPEVIYNLKKGGKNEG